MNKEVIKSGGVNHFSHGGRIPKTVRKYMNPTKPMQKSCAS